MSEKNFSTSSNKKPFYKKWWVWVLAIFILGAIGSNGDIEETTSTSEAEETVEVTKEPELTA